MPFDADVSRSDLIDAFLHPPRIVVIGDRRQSPGGWIDVLSHVELWPWRIQVRGVRAQKNFVPFGDRGTESKSFTPALDQPRAPVPTAADIERRHERARWLMAWTVADDLGTEYSIAGARNGGPGGDLWWDYSVTFHPGTPSGASVLTLTPPEAEPVSISVADA